MRQQAAPAVVASSEADVAPSPDPGCENGRDNRKSDLCAQWKAADAGFQAAQAAREQALVGWIGAMLGFVTMFAAIFAAVFAKQAAEQTQRGADAAKSSLTHALIVSEAQLRPYVFFKEDDEAVKRPLDFTRNGSLVVNIKNFGQTPADNVRIYYGECLMSRPIGNAIVEVLPDPVSFGRLGPGAETSTTFRFIDLPEETFEAVRTTPEVYLFRLKVVYNFFGERSDSEDMTLFIGYDHVIEGSKSHLLTDEERQRPH